MQELKVWLSESRLGYLPISQKPVYATKGDSINYVLRNQLHCTANSNFGFDV